MVLPFKYMSRLFGSSIPFFQVKPMFFKMNTRDGEVNILSLIFIKRADFLGILSNKIDIKQQWRCKSIDSRVFHRKTTGFMSFITSISRYKCTLVKVLPSTL